MVCLKCVNVCMTFTKWIPVIFVMAVLSWSYYAYVVQLCFYNVEQWAKRIIYLIIYHILLIIFVWSYLKTIFSPIKKPPEEFYLKDTEIYQIEVSQNENTAKIILDKKAKELPILTRGNNLSIRYCEKCKCLKPDRAHHCGVCQTCVLKMDHHCPWVNNCVGYNNYKFFLLFLFYAVTYCLFIACTSLEYFIKFWNEIQTFQPGKFHLLFLFFISIMFGISVFSLFAYHLYLVCQNTTTLETFRAPVFYTTGLPDKRGFNLTKLENCKQVFGNNLLKAFLPINTSTIDGINYANNINVSNETKNSNIKLLNDFNLTKLSSDNCKLVKINSKKPTDSLSLKSNTINNISLSNSNAKTNSSINDQNNHELLNQSKNMNHQEPQFKYNSVKTILQRHQSITFASIFKSQSVFKNQSTDPSSELIDSVIAYNKTDTTSCNNDYDFSDENFKNSRFNNNNNNNYNVNISKSKSNDSYKSSNDGINFPISIRQAMATTNSDTFTAPSHQYDSLLLNDNNALVKNNINEQGDIMNSHDERNSHSNGQVRIFMD